MKILLTLDNTLDNINGVVFALKTLQKILTKRGNEVRLLVLSNDLHSTYLDGVWYASSIPINNVYPDFRFCHKISKKIIKEIIEWSPDIINSESESTLFFYARKLSKKLKIPHVHTVHTNYEDYYGYLPITFLGSFISKSFCRKLFANIDGLTVSSNKIKNFLIRHGYKNKIDIIPIGIDEEVFYKVNDENKLLELRKKLNINQDKKIIILVSRLAKEKNIEEIINYFNEYNNSDFILLIVGDGPLKDSLEKLAISLHLEDKLIFTGFINHEDLKYYYSLADVFVSASTSEAQGLTYYEALSTGLPILCRYDTCFVENLLNNDFTYFYKTKEEFFMYLNNLLSNKIEASLDLKYKADIYGKNIEEFYKRILSN